MNKYQHIIDYLKEKLSEIPEVTVVSGGLLDQELSRPSIRIYSAGESMDSQENASMRNASARITLEVHIEDDDLEQERNELAECIEYAIDGMEIPPFINERYRVEFQLVQWESASGVLDDGQRSSEFLCTVTVSFIQTVIK